MKRAICLWKRTNRSSRSFLMSDLNESLMVVLLQTARRANRFCRSLKRATEQRATWAIHSFGIISGENCQKVLKKFKKCKGRDGNSLSLLFTKERPWANRPFLKKSRANCHPCSSHRSTLVDRLEEFPPPRPPSSHPNYLNYCHYVLLLLNKQDSQIILAQILYLV